MEFETNIWAVAQNLDSTMESPLYELELATHRGSRLTTHPSPAANKEWVSRKGDGFFLDFCYPHNTCQSLPSHPYKVGLMAAPQHCPAEVGQHHPVNPNPNPNPGPWGNTGTTFERKTCQPFVLPFE